MTKRLIVNADDLGHSPNVNRGVFEAHAEGIVTSSTVMINRPAAPAALDYALAHAPKLGLGLHLNLTKGVPITPSTRLPSLVDDTGHFHHIGQWAAHFDRFDAGEIECELRAQFDRFVALAGQPPDHLDAHHHAAYIHPAAQRTMLSLAAAYDIPLRTPRAAHGLDAAVKEIGGILGGGFPAERVRTLADALIAVLDAAVPAPRWPDIQCRDFYDATATLGDLLNILVNLKEDAVTELMCHPGYAEGIESVYAAQRERELAALTHPSVHELIAAEAIELVTFAALGAVGLG